MTEYPKKRNLDGVYFRVKRNGKYDNICFTDLTVEEQMKVCENRSVEWLQTLAMHLSGIICGIAKQLDLEYVDDEKEVE